jgi:hypothetical protein
MNDEYVTASEDRQQEVDFYKNKSNQYFEELEDTDTQIHHLEARIAKLEHQLDGQHKYTDQHGSKHACYDSSMGYGSGSTSLMRSTSMGRPPSSTQKVSTSYAGALQSRPTTNDQQDTDMEDGEMARFPSLPMPSQLFPTTTGGITVPRGTMWNLAPRGRQPGRGMVGGFGVHPMRERTLVITSLEELDQYTEAANRPGDKLVLAQMCAYVREVHQRRREERSPIMEVALLKWKTPDWVPPEACPPAKAGGPNAPPGVNTPQMMSLPEEWAT